MRQGGNLQVPTPNTAASKHRLTCDSVEEGREDWAADSRLGPSRCLLVVLEAVLEGGVDAKHAR